MHLLAVLLYAGMNGGFEESFIASNNIFSWAAIVCTLTVYYISVDNVLLVKPESHDRIENIFIVTAFLLLLIWNITSRSGMSYPVEDIVYQSRSKSEASQISQIGTAIKAVRSAKY